MKTHFSISAVMLSVLTHPAIGQQPVLDDIATLRWDHRVILAALPDAEAAAQSLWSVQAQIDDRDIVWFVFAKDEIKTNFPGSLAASFQEAVEAEYGRLDHRVLLIGKDGGTKRQLSALSIDVLFDDIDAMPMRRREMQQRE